MSEDLDSGTALEAAGRLAAEMLSNPSKFDNPHPRAGEVMDVSKVPCNEVWHVHAGVGDNALLWAIETAPVHPHLWCHDFKATPLQILLTVAQNVINGKPGRNPYELNTSLKVLTGPQIDGFYVDFELGEHVRSEVNFCKYLIFKESRKTANVLVLTAQDMITLSFHPDLMELKSYMDSESAKAGVVPEYLWGLKVIQGNSASVGYRKHME